MSYFFNVAGRALIAYYFDSAILRLS